MMFLKTAGALCLLVAAAVSQTAVGEDLKYIGTWQALSGQSTYTKLIIHDTDTVTYCYVQSCRQQDCWKWKISGDTLNTFSYEHDTGSYEFTRLNESELEATYTNPSGDVSFAFYNPQ